MTNKVHLIFATDPDSGQVAVPHSRDIIAVAQMCLRDPDTYRIAGALTNLAHTVLRLERQVDQLVAAAGLGGLRLADRHPAGIANVPRCRWCPVPDAPDPRYHPDGITGHTAAEQSPRTLQRGVDPLTCPHPLPDPTPPIDPWQCLACGAMVWPVESTAHEELDGEVPGAA